MACPGSSSHSSRTLNGRIDQPPAKQPDASTISPVSSSSLSVGRPSRAERSSPAISGQSPVG
jgi:hypothetical protein